MTITSVELVERRPTVDEYRRLISAVGWKPRDTEAISRALASSQFAVCAETGREVVGMGRVIGDGGLHYDVTDIVVVPAFQRRGLGSRIVRRPHDVCRGRTVQEHVGRLVSRGGDSRLLCALWLQSPATEWPRDVSLAEPERRLTPPRRGRSVRFVHPVSKEVFALGGTTEGRARANEDWWPKALAFLKAAAAG